MQVVAAKHALTDAVRFAAAVVLLLVRVVARIFAKMIALWGAKDNVPMVALALAEGLVEMHAEEVAMVQLEFFKWKE